MPKKTVLCTGKYLQLIKLDGYEMVDRVNCTGIVVVVAVTDARELVLVEQFRMPVQSKVIELPAGLVNDKGSSEEETLEQAAKRELLEETGFEASQLDEIAKWPTSAGMASELVTVFRARDLKRTGDGGGDEEESITVHLAKIDDIDSWLDERSKDGILVDPKIFAALHLLSR